MTLSNELKHTLGLCVVIETIACSLQMPNERDVFGSGSGTGSTGGTNSTPNGSGAGGRGNGSTVEPGLGGTTFEPSGTQPSSGGGATNSATASSTVGGATLGSSATASSAMGGAILDNTALDSRSTGGTSASANPSNGGVGALAGASGGSTTGSGASLADGLVAFYPFDETTGTAVANLVDTTRDGTYVGACTHPDGKLGGAVQVRNYNSNVSGSSDWIELPSGSLSNLSAATVALWVRDLSPTRQGARAFDFSRGSDEQFYFSPHETNTADSTEGAHLVVTHAGSTLVEFWSTSPAFTDKFWHHVAVSWSSDALVLYLDGKSAGSTAAPGVVPSELGVTSPDWLGRCLGDAFIAFYGEFDELRIYDRALSSSEVTGLYQLR